MDPTRLTIDLPSPSSVTHFFANANSPSIHGGQFYAVGVMNSAVGGRDTKDPFEHLQRHVATSAFHNSAMRVDPPRCHQNTRAAVIEDIFNWILRQATREDMILWLTGAAGAGKSAIGQSIAELCTERGILVSSFFFSRTDITRNSVEKVIATLVYQLILLVPVIKSSILQTIESNPLIFKQSFEAQADELIFRPLVSLEQSHVSWKLLIIIDGVDECREDAQQNNMVLAMAKLLQGRNLPLMVLFGSREEHRLRMTFNSLKSVVRHVPLDERYLPQADIRLFIFESFMEIKGTHPFTHLLENGWPEDEVLEGIIQKSSGQFVYAAVVMKFLSMPDSNPAQQLEIVQGLRPSGEETPFAQLDALYRHIFSCVKNLHLVMSILAYVILGDDPNLFSLSRLLGLPQSELEVALAALTSVVICRRRQYEPPSVVFLHESMTDFFLDKKRSGACYIDASTWSNHFLLLWFQKVDSDQSLVIHLNDNCRAITKLLRYATGSTELRESVMNFKPVYAYRHMLVDFLTGIQQIDFEDEGKAYQHQLEACTRVLWGIDPALLGPLLDSEHDVFVLMSIIEDEIKQTQDARASEAKEQETVRKAQREKLTKKEIGQQKTALREFDEREGARRIEERLKYDLDEAQKRRKERQDFQEREEVRREHERKLYELQETERRDKDRKEYDAAEVARREAERREFYLQEGVKREQWRRQEKLKILEEQEEDRREAAKREFDIQEEERREAIRREFDMQEAARREAAINATAIAPQRKSSVWSRLRGNRNK